MAATDEQIDAIETLLVELLKHQQAPDWLRELQKQYNPRPAERETGTEQRQRREIQRILDRAG